MLYGGLRLSVFVIITPSVAFGGPGSSSKNSSASTRTRRISPVSMYMRSEIGESRSSCWEGTWSGSDSGGV